MEVREIVRVTSKGQVTIPLIVQKILNLEKGSTIVFKITEKGVMLTPCEVKEMPPYTEEEWGKIQRLVAEKGRIFKSGGSAKKFLKSL